MQGPGSIPTGGSIFSLDFFHIVKPLMPILPLLPIFLFAKNPDVVAIRSNVCGIETDCGSLEKPLFMPGEFAFPMWYYTKVSSLLSLMDDIRIYTSPLG